jgi:very-short-patch-repair endonuclease
MSKRYCKCPNDHCFDRAIQCCSCDPEDLDPEGYPSKARRRLTNEENGKVQDVDDKQWFDVKKVKGGKGGKRLVPHFEGPVDWKSAKGFASMYLILSCLGAEGEYVLWDVDTDEEMAEKEWCKRKFYAKNKPPVRHRVCKEVVTSTSINHLQQGRSIGCTCNLSMANHWRHRRPEIVAKGAENGFEVLTTEEEWVDECNNALYCPKLKCVECKQVVTSTNLTHLQQSRGIGCRCNWSLLNLWRDRRPEVVQWGNEHGFEVLTTEDEWADECDRNTYCPKLKCVECGEVVTSTCINSLQRCQGIGCSCHNKTEAKLRLWLEKKYPEATVNTQYCGPKTDRNGQTHFDFHLTFPDRFEVLIELDGAQHFWSHLKYYTDGGCERDLLKEKWAIARGLSVVRVLQEDVWEDNLGWQKWLTKSIENARTGEPRVFTPDAPEYQSANSAYVQLRSSCEPAAIQL